MLHPITHYISELNALYRAGNATEHSYRPALKTLLEALTSLTFRGMCYNLLKTLDKIHIFNLHGNAKKKETAPDGSEDKNVFDIQQGVSINIFVKLKNNDYEAK
jgi:hypothetical protein